MANWEFPRTEPIDLQVQIASGDVRISAEPTDAVRVSVRAAGSDDECPDVRVDYADGRLEIAELADPGLRHRSTDFDVTVTVPAGSRCGARTGSADVSCQGDPGPVNLSTASGDVRIEAVRDGSEVHTASGTVSIGVADADVQVHTASGDIQVGRARAAVTAMTASGDIRVDGTASVTARTASGDIKLAGIASGQVEANSVSGDITVLVAPGTGVYLELSSLTGQVSSELEPEAEPAEHIGLCVTCHSMSGAVRVRRSAPASALS